MNIITKIEEQIKNKNRVNIYINNNYCFSCNIEMLTKHNLKEGVGVIQDKLLKLIEEDNQTRGFRLAMYYLSYRPRTKYEINNYLLKKGYDDLVVNKIIEKLLYYNYIDDKQYTKNYITNCIESKAKSSEIVKLELIKKGISIDVIDEYISMFSHDINLEIAKEISIKYFYKKSNLPYKQLKDKLAQLLAGKRFSWEIINNCLNFLDQDENIQSIISSKKDDYQLQALKLAEKYFLRYSKKESSVYLLKQKIKQALYRKGFDIDIINTTVDNIEYDQN